MNARVNIQVKISCFVNSTSVDVQRENTSLSGLYMDYAISVRNIFW